MKKNEYQGGHFISTETGGRKMSVFSISYCLYHPDRQAKVFVFSKRRAYPFCKSCWVFAGKIGQLSLSTVKELEIDKRVELCDLYDKMKIIKYIFVLLGAFALGSLFYVFVL